jgi:hypothetical protein
MLDVELKRTPEEVEREVAHAKARAIELAKAQAECVKAGRPRKDENAPDGHNCSRGGSSPENLLRRLAHSHPDILARYEAGEFESVRAAAREAGIVREPTPLEEAKQIAKRLVKLFREISPDEKRRVLKVLQGRERGSPERVARSGEAMGSLLKTPAGGQI